MNIVKPEIHEIPAVFEIIAACRKKLDSEGIYQWDDYYPNMDVVIDDFNNNTIHVYKNDGAVVGIITFDEQQHQEYQQVEWFYNEGKILVIHRLAVRPDYQKQGIARQLLNSAEQTALQAGFLSVRLDAYSGNSRAIQFYRKLGYETRGEVFFPKRTLPFYCMEKKLK